MTTQETQICICGHEKSAHNKFGIVCLQSLTSGNEKAVRCPCKKFQARKSKLFPSKQIKGMLTDGQGAYYPDDTPQKKQVTLPSVVVSEEIRE